MKKLFIVLMLLSLNAYATVAPFVTPHKTPAYLFFRRFMEWWMRLFS